jgi:hypothetical protein
MALRDTVRDRGMKRLVLETGTVQPDAIRFYENTDSPGFLCSEHTENSSFPIAT